jgi:hypothetical protein
MPANVVEFLGCIAVSVMEFTAQFLIFMSSFLAIATHLVGDILGANFSCYSCKGPFSKWIGGPSSSSIFANCTSILGMVWVSKACYNNLSGKRR